VLADVHNTVFRDNIENNRIIPVSDRVRRIVDAPEFQRLRHIRQMGLSSYVFPTAEHSRFAHSLGVYATARQAFLHLKQRAITFDFQTPGLRFDDDLESEFSIAALCHDIGHSAFSHVLETILLPDGLRSHEECTREILSDPQREISKAISSTSDLQSVLALLERRHPNKALSDLISSTFDVDRCDYILRDSLMSGVEYGSYDLKWLLHAMAIETNSLYQPVLLLDGPHGLDALRQFLSARRYLHRQVYLHPTIRAAQILLKAIFSRIQDLPPSDETRRLVPKSLRQIVDHNKLSIDDFLQTRDIEVNFLVTNLAEHSDPTLRYLASLFLERKFPKCILDSSRSSSAISTSFRIQDETDDLPGYAQLTSVVEELRPHISTLMRRQGLPEEAANYLVAYDPADFDSTAPTDLLFSFGENVVTFPEIDSDCVGFDVESLLDAFRIHRIFVPRGFEQSGKELLREKYAIIAAESGGADD
jgi:HD superfamily phosphohydrolase